MKQIGIERLAVGTSVERASIGSHAKHPQHAIGNVIGACFAIFIGRKNGAQRQLHLRKATQGIHLAIAEASRIPTHEIVGDGTADEHLFHLSRRERRVSLQPERHDARHRGRSHRSAGVLPPIIGNARSRMRGGKRKATREGSVVAGIIGIERGNHHKARCRHRGVDIAIGIGAKRRRRHEIARFHSGIDIRATGKHRHRISRGIVAHRNHPERRSIVVEIAGLRAGHHQHARQFASRKRTAPKPTIVPHPIRINPLQSQQIVDAALLLFQIAGGLDIEFAIEPHGSEHLNFAIHPLIQTHVEIIVVHIVDARHHPHIGRNNRAGIHHLLGIGMQKEHLHANGVGCAAPRVDSDRCHHTIHSIG